MASSTTGVKRTRSEAVIPYTPMVQQPVRQIPKRIRRITDKDIHDVPTILKSDRNGFAKFDARAQFLASLNIPDHAILGLIRGLASDYHAFLSIVDLNVYQANIISVINDFITRSVPLTTLNIRSHAFCMNAKASVLASFESFYGHQRWPCDVATYVANNVFHQEEAISITVLGGGGVRDILITEWCRTYYTGSATPPQLIVITSRSGRVFLVPFLA